MPVASLKILTMTPCNTPPDESTTRPPIWPVEAWDCALAGYDERPNATHAIAVIRWNDVSRFTASPIREVRRGEWSSPGWRLARRCMRASRPLDGSRFSEPGQNLARRPPSLLEGPAYVLFFVRTRITRRPPWLRSGGRSWGAARARPL